MRGLASRLTTELKGCTSRSFAGVTYGKINYNGSQILGHNSIAVGAICNPRFILGAPRRLLSSPVNATASTSSSPASPVSNPIASKTSSVGEALIIEARKKNIAQSPWKMNFLVKLIRGAWLPDALAQLKFSPKHRAVDVGRIVQRASAIARTFHDLVPEELMIHEVFVTKGFQQKRQRIMGRGRTGIGYKRRTHVTVKVAKIDFENKIANATSKGEKVRWEKRYALVKKIKAGGGGGGAAAGANSSSK